MTDTITIQITEVWAICLLGVLLVGAAKVALWYLELVLFCWRVLRCTIRDVVKFRPRHMLPGSSRWVRLLWAYPALFFVIAKDQAIADLSGSFVTISPREPEETVSTS